MSGSWPASPASSRQVLRTAAGVIFRGVDVHYHSLVIHFSFRKICLVPRHDRLRPHISCYPVELREEGPIKEDRVPPPSAIDRHHYRCLFPKVGLYHQVYCPWREERRSPRAMITASASPSTARSPAFSDPLIPSWYALLTTIASSAVSGSSSPSRRRLPEPPRSCRLLTLERLGGPSPTLCTHQPEAAASASPSSWTGRPQALWQRLSVGIRRRTKDK